jgi:pimeloyl-ACP methyl ester carboxylesterase
MTTRQHGPTRYARNGQADIAYEDLGGAGGDPLLLLMGMGVSRFWWPGGFVRELVSRGFHVVAYDQRDAGESSRFPDGHDGGPIAAVLRGGSPAYSAEDMADDAMVVLDAMGWDSAHLFGASMGGLLAQRVALRHPERVQSLTSMAAQPSDVHRLATARYIRFGTLARLARMKAHAQGREGDMALGVALSRALASPAYPFDETAARQRIERDQRSGVRDIGAQRRQAAARWHGGRLAELTMPALILHGDADPLLRPSAGRDTAKAIRGARLVILSGVGHDLPREAWPQVASEVRVLADRARLPSWTLQEPQTERREHQDNADVHRQSLPELVLEEQNVHGDHNSN